jgi:Putative Actinobacterial Holin-X, holin superfamily III
VAETVDEAAASLSEGETEEPEETPSLTELIAELGHDVTVLAFLEGQLAVSRNLPEVRRAARDIAAAVIVAIAYATAFAFLNVAAVYGLSRVVSWWLAALILAAVWIAIGTGLLVALSVRAGRVTGWRWWRVFKEGCTTRWDDSRRPSPWRSPLRRFRLPEAWRPASSMRGATCSRPPTTSWKRWRRISLAAAS